MKAKEIVSKINKRQIDESVVASVDMANKQVRSDPQVRALVRVLSSSDQFKKSAEGIAKGARDDDWPKMAESLATAIVGAHLALLKAK